MSLSDPDYAALMNWAELETTVIDDALMRERDTTDGETRQQATTLYYVLSGLVEGTAYALVDDVTDKNGFEAWRNYAHDTAELRLTQQSRR